MTKKHKIQINDEYEIETVEQLFRIFQLVLEDGESNKRELSFLSMLVDLYSIRDTVDLFLNNPSAVKKKKYAERADNFVFVTLVMILHESLLIYSEGNEEKLKENETLFDLTKLLRKAREEIKHFQFRSFGDRINDISKNMGRLNDKNNPTIDTIVYFEEKKFVGTNVNLFISYEKKNLSTVLNLNTMLNLILGFFDIKHDAII